MSDVLDLESYPARSHDKLRYSDTDRQGHVNNAVFATLLETGRVELLRDPERPLADEDAEWVIAHLGLDYLGEVHWPGRIDVGTRVLRVGRTSVTLEQALFQDGRRVAVAETVIVQLDPTTRTGHPLSTTARTAFEALRV